MARMCPLKRLPLLSLSCSSSSLPLLFVVWATSSMKRRTPFDFPSPAAPGGYVDGFPTNANAIQTGRSFKAVVNSLGTPRWTTPTTKTQHQLRRWSCHTSSSWSLLSTQKKLHTMDCVRPKSRSCEAEATKAPNKRARRRIAVVGGGLAGLSVAHHLLRKTFDRLVEGVMATSASPPGEASKMSTSAIAPPSAAIAETIDITIYDQTLHPGEGGASSVAGGLLHPFSPRGKLLYLGLEGLRSTNHLVNAACRHRPDSILRHQLYRIAITEKDKKQLMETAYNFPEIATWCTREDIFKRSCIIVSNEGGQVDEGDVLSDVLGGLELRNSCKVLHVPTYLKGLWDDCMELGRNIIDLELSNDNDRGDVQAKARADGALEAVRWVTIPSVCNEDEVDDDAALHPTPPWNEHGRDYDTIVYAAGSGLFRGASNTVLPKTIVDCLPITLVRGQSIVLARTPCGNEKIRTPLFPQEDALLCGKYVTPTKEPNRVVLGATHEYHPNIKLSPSEVESELLNKTIAFAPPRFRMKNAGKYCYEVDEITSGWRVQSNRGKHGRLPIVGRLPFDGSCQDDEYEEENGSRRHDDAWIFTGLSSRGLIYHGILGDILSDSILHRNEASIYRMYPELEWWKKIKI